MPDSLLKLRSLTRQFSGLCAVDDVHLSVDDGEILGIIGPNGSGKTTLFNLVTGVYEPSRGDIRFRGKLIGTRSRARIARMGIARTFQAPRLFGELTVSDHIQVAVPNGTEPGLSGLLRCVGRGRPSNLRRVEEVLEVVGLSADASSRADDLPYGKRRLLELGRCLAASPSLLLLDEPTAGLNDEESANLAALLNNLVAQSQISLIVIDHNVPFLKQLCPRFAVMNRGRLIADGTPDYVLSLPEVVEAYLGEDG